MRWLVTFPVSEGSLKGCPTISGISLVPKEWEQTYWREATSRHSVSVAHYIPPCQIDNQRILASIRYNLSGLINERHLYALGQGIAAPLALVMTRLYLSFRENANEAERDIANTIEEICLCEIKKSPLRRMLSHDLIKFNLYTASPACLRLDEDGYSICTGNMVIGVQFLFVEIILGGAARIWFLADQVKLCTMDLSLEELLDLEVRFNFKKPAVWSSGTGPRKEITYRARLVHTNPFVIVKASESTPDIAHRFCVEQNHLSQESKMLVMLA
jgi:hypothetical protein